MVSVDPSSSHNSSEFIPTSHSPTELMACRLARRVLQNLLCPASGIPLLSELYAGALRIPNASLWNRKSP